MTTQIKQPSDHLSFPDFDDIKVSTKTYTVKTNIDVDIRRVSELLPITDYIVVPRRRGRKKKGVVIDPNKDVPYGSIITVECMGNIRGVETKPNKNKNTLKKKKKQFRNSITVVIVLDKLINFKIYKNGTFQMTGCKTHNHVEMCVKYTWDYIKHDPTLYTYLHGSCLEALFIPAMRNIDFNLGFKVDREKLDNYISTHTDWFCLLETSFGYTGVNIRVPLQSPITDLVIKKVELKSVDDDWNEGEMVPYQQYLDILTPKERKIKTNKKGHNTFLVFQSGCTIMSSQCSSFARPIYYEFLKVIRDCYEQIEERLD